MPKSAVRIVVTGLVQGVGFRYFVHREAARLELDGYVSNLSSGQVEIVAYGPKGLIDELVKVVRVGPRYASVSDVQLEEITPPDNVKGFLIH